MATLAGRPAIRFFDNAADAKCSAVIIARLIFILSIAAIAASADSSNDSNSTQLPKTVASSPVSVKLGGELELEFVRCGNDADNTNPRIQLDKFTLKPKVAFTEHVALAALLLFKFDKAYCSEAYAVFSGLPLNSSLKAGLDDRFLDENPGRKTEAITLLETSFFRSDEFAITWSAHAGAVYWNCSVSNGFVLGATAPIEDNSYKIISDKKQDTDYNLNKEAGAEIGVRSSKGSRHAFDIHAFGFNARLSKSDVAFLQGIEGYGGFDDRRNYLYGAALEYGYGGFGLAAAGAKAQDGVLDRLAGFAQVSYAIPLLRGSYLTRTEPLVRYDYLKNDLRAVPDDALTWDRHLVTLAIITTVAKGVKIKSEYYISREETGGEAPDNDELLVQLEMKF